LYRLVWRWVAHNNEINPGVNSAPRNVVGREAASCFFAQMIDRFEESAALTGAFPAGRHFSSTLDPHCGSHFFEIASPRPDLGLFICGSAEQGCHECRDSHIPKEIFHHRKGIAKGKERKGRASI